MKLGLALSALFIMEATQITRGESFSARSVIHEIRGGDVHSHRPSRESITTRAVPASTQGDDTVEPLVRWGDYGNILTAILSFFLLRLTPFNVVPCSVEEPCKAVLDTGNPYTGDLDSCYVCDGFCITDPTSVLWNSHMLSLYADIIMFIPLLVLRAKQEDRLEQLGLNEYYLSSQKVWSVFGHGIAHGFLSYLSHQQQVNALVVGRTSQLANAVALLFARFANQDTWIAIQEIFKKDFETLIPEKPDLQSKILRHNVAPFLTGTLLAQVTHAPQEASPIQFAIFGVTCWLFFEAGIPPAPNRTIFAIIMSVITTYISVGVIGVKNVPQSFVVVFTSAYLVSAIFQVFFWKEGKNKDPVPYAVTAWSSNLLTTLVGWLLALKCAWIKKIGGHVWYDLSIPFSYWLIFWISSARG